MVPLLQLFDFAYQNGFLFFDRSGALACRLQEILPGLAFDKTSLDQRDFILPGEDLELFFGIARSRIETFSPDSDEFPSTAANFLQIVTELLEVTQLEEFHFRYVLGKPCGSDEEAQELMRSLVPSEMISIAEPQNWGAIQGEFFRGNLAYQSRIAIMDLIPHEKLSPGEPKTGLQVPHITFHFDVRGLVPIDVAGFDAKAFMINVRENHTREILAKLAHRLS